jgi:hypothetical protein
VIASRELDALVAEKVMGWTEVSSRGMGIRHDWPKPIQDVIPSYSANMNAAWKVVEKMAKLGYWCQIRNEFEARGGPDCWAGFTPHSTTGWNGRPDHWTQAETVPLAICLAALHVVGVSP